MAWMTALNHATMRWAAGGWVFFIAENAILSENRTYLIQRLGDDQYHAAYGTLSTVATASIGYAYYTIRKTMTTTTASSIMPRQLALWKSLTPPIPLAVGGWIFLTIGLTMASQAIPKMQIPLAVVQSNTTSSTMQASSDTQLPSPASTPPQPPTTAGSYSLQVRCPFDFSDKKSGTTDYEVHGLERVSRHPGLWSLGLIGLGQACLVPTLPQRIWWMGPTAVAWLGGAHTDSRFRRHIGGTLTPEYDSQTSNIPFWAMICGKQGSGAIGTFLGEELKPLNAGAALVASSLWVLRRVR
jgi:hypothetical protein